RRQRELALALELIERLLRALFAASIELGDVGDLEPVEVGRLARELRFDDLMDELVAPLHRARRVDPVVDAAFAERLALVVVPADQVLALGGERRVAARARRRNHRARALVALDDLLDVRDHIVAPRDEDFVADAEAQPPDVRRVVEGRALYHRAGE